MAGIAGGLLGAGKVGWMMNDILALIVAVLGVLIACAVLGGIIYAMCLIIRQAQKRDKAIKEFEKKFKQGRL